MTSFYVDHPVHRMFLPPLLPRRLALYADEIVGVAGVVSDVERCHPFLDSHLHPPLHSDDRLVFEAVVEVGFETVVVAAEHEVV
jgi:hypothetical protein